MSTEWLIFLVFFQFSGSGVLAENITMDACEPKQCGNSIISYPFWINGQQPDYCGYPSFKIDCADGKPVLAESYNYDYYIGEIFYGNNSAVLINSVLANNTDYCPINDLNVSVSLSQFIHDLNVSVSLSQFVISPSPLNKELIFFSNCSKPTKPLDYSLLWDCTNQEYFLNDTFVYLNYPNETQDLPDHLPSDLPSDCSSISRVLVLGTNNYYWGIVGDVSFVQQMVAKGFLVQWMVADCSLCKESNGRCGFSRSVSDFRCICSNGTGSDGIMYPISCPVSDTGARSQSHKILIGSTIAGALAFIVVCCIFLIKRQLLRIFFWKHNTQESIENILEKYGSLAPKKYKFCELKKITNSFRDKLGKGGFGTVYKGIQQDGRFVAVKFLHNSTSNGEEFINEVISISRTSHVNVVNLLGFCIEGSKQALVYEYMLNGSLDKYIHSENPETNLGWEKLYEIAIGIARGLEYLHSGCNTHIVHFDIKPQNILLDEDFYPKIADFGLAKLCPQKESILSLADMRGTIGFMAPEVFSRSIGVVSTKSDVYSFGMLLLEMVGGRKNSKISVQNSSQAYFPHWIYDHIIQNSEIQVCDVTNEKEEIARKMALIGLWCIQIAPASRPSMSKVMEMFEKNLDELEMPPKPYFNSPPRISILLSLDSISES